MSSGNPDRKTSVVSSLGSRDRRILEDVIRYRVITNEWILRRYFKDAKPNAAVKISIRLTRDGWLNSHKLFKHKKYYTPGPRLVRCFGLPVGQMRPLGTQALASCYSAMRYCAVSGGDQDGSTIHLASVEDVMTSLPWLPKSFHGRLLVLCDVDEEVSWKLIRVDMGGRPDHVARKIVQDISSLNDASQFLAQLNERRFTQVVLCPSPGKKRLVEQSLSERSWIPGIRFQIGVIPELFQILGSQ